MNDTGLIVHIDAQHACLVLTNIVGKTTLQGLMQQVVQGVSELDVFRAGLTYIVPNIAHYHDHVWGEEVIGMVFHCLSSVPKCAFPGEWTNKKLATKFSFAPTGNRHFISRATLKDLKLLLPADVEFLPENWFPGWDGNSHVVSRNICILAMLSIFIDILRQDAHQREFQKQLDEILNPVL